MILHSEKEQQQQMRVNNAIHFVNICPPAPSVLSSRTVRKTKPRRMIAQECRYYAIHFCINRKISVNVNLTRISISIELK